MLSKSIEVIERIARGWPHSVNQLARELRIAPATCYRIVATLEASGWLRRSASGRIELHPDLPQRLAASRSSIDALIAAASPVMERLSRSIGLGVKLSAREGDVAVTLARCDPPASDFSLSGAAPGTKFHLCYGSSGAVLCAGLDDAALAALVDRAPADVWRSQSPAEFRRRVAAARRAGTSVDRGSFRTGVHTISARIDTGDAAHPAALTVLALPDQLPAESLAAIRASVIEAAAEIMRNVGGTPR